MRLEDAIDEMVERQLHGRGINDRRVLDAVRAVPRHHFAPHCSLAEAYADHPLPTEHGQTISQPFIVGLMTELLDVWPGMKVLEIGTGSGYQTAILAELGADITTIEHHASLAERARQTLAELCPGKPIRVIIGDGTLGYPPNAPYDRILVTAGAPDLPIAYKQQLADGGRIVIPIGDFVSQVLTIYERDGEVWRVTYDTPCRFVPLVGAEGWVEAG